MSIAEIEAELEKLSAENLRRIALKSWKAFLAKENEGANEVSEDDPDLLAALDEAIQRAEAKSAEGMTANQVREKLAQWTSK